MLIFCIPHAGGSSLSYLKWKLYLNKEIKFVPLDYPGHITRSKEALQDDFYLVLDDLYRTLSKEIASGEEYAIFGHSIGAVFAYELYNKIEAAGERLPVGLIFSGRWPPYLQKDDEWKHIDYEEFKARFPIGEDLYNMNRINEELGDYYYRIIYNDLQLLNSYTPGVQPCRISTEISVIWGTEDKSVSYREVCVWKQAAGGKINFKAIEGTHMFPTENVEETVEMINEVLMKSRIFV
jgi:surfactin synthase thioesterase subunit